MDILYLLVAERGFEPPDLRVMSPTSYLAALLRDIYLRPLLSAYELYHYYYMLSSIFLFIFLIFCFYRKNCYKLTFLILNLLYFYENVLYNH